MVKRETAVSIVLESGCHHPRRGGNEGTLPSFCVLLVPRAPDTIRMHQLPFRPQRSERKRERPLRPQLETERSDTRDLGDSVPRDETSTTSMQK